jgi:hypothetical protein
MDKMVQIKPVHLNRGLNFCNLRLSHFVKRRTYFKKIDKSRGQPQGKYGLHSISTHSFDGSGRVG